MRSKIAELELTGVVHSAVGRDDPATLCALGVLAYAASMLTHEALGHGASCIIVGGHNEMLTGVGESHVRRSLMWISAAVLIGGAFLLLIGPGIGTRYAAIG